MRRGSSSSLCGNLIENYLELSAAEWERYGRLVARKEYRKVQDVELDWLDRAELKGKHEALLIVLEAKFGPLGKGTTTRVRALASPNAVDACLERVLTANSLDEMELDRR